MINKLESHTYTVILESDTKTKQGYYVQIAIILFRIENKSHIARLTKCDKGFSKSFQLTRLKSRSNSRNINHERLLHIIYHKN